MPREGTFEERQRLGAPAHPDADPRAIDRGHRAPACFLLLPFEGGLPVARQPASRDRGLEAELVRGCDSLVDRPLSFRRRS